MSFLSAHKQKKVRKQLRQQKAMIPLFSATQQKKPSGSLCREPLGFFCWKNDKSSGSLKSLAVASPKELGAK
jgi:hypothetical protein